MKIIANLIIEVLRLDDMCYYILMSLLNFYKGYKDMNKRFVFRFRRDLAKSVSSLFIMLTLILVSTSSFFYFESPLEVNAAQTDASEIPDWPDQPEIFSKSAILIDADTGAILYQKDPYTRSYPASTTKIMTGLLTIENCSMSDTVTFSSAAANSVTWEDASLGTKAGEQYTVEQALYGLLLHSANEIAYGLGEHVSGSIPAFAELMNQRAKELGALNTHFSNASGLHDENHYTTAYDMAMIARGCYNNTAFVNIDSTADTYSIPATNLTSEPRYFKHRHLMLKGRQYYYEYCKGGKTGFTDQAQYTLVTFAEKNDMRLIAVCFKSGANERFEDTRKLFDWGFKNFKKETASSNSAASVSGHDSYLYSDLFSESDVVADLKTSTITLPNVANVEDVVLDTSDMYEPEVKDGVYTASMNYKYQDSVIGTVDLKIASPEALKASSNLPYKTDAASNLKAKTLFKINIWYLAAGLALIVIFVLIMKYRAIRKARRRYGKRKLRF